MRLTSTQRVRLQSQKLKYYIQTRCAYIVWCFGLLDTVSVACITSVRLWGSRVRVCYRNVHTHSTKSLTQIYVVCIEFESVQTCMPIDRQLSASLLSSWDSWVTLVVVAVVMVTVLLVTCWLFGPWTCALAASMEAVRAFMLLMLSVELLRPDWPVARTWLDGPPLPLSSLYASCADSVLLWAVMEMCGRVGVDLGGTGGGVFL